MFEAIDRMRAAVFALLHEVPNPNLFQELTRMLDYWSRRADALVTQGLARREVLVDALDRRLNGSRRWASDEEGAGSPGPCPLPPPYLPVEGQADWQALCSLAERALPANSALASLKAFGAALGKAELSIYQHEAPDPLPSLQGLVYSARALPKEYTQRVPWLRQLLRISPAKADLEFQSTLEKLKAKGMRYRSICLQLFTSWHGEVEAVFIGATVAPPPGKSKDLPRWDRVRGELYFRGELVRTVRGRTVATRLVAILNAFQDAGWPEAIKNPLPPGRDDQAIYQTIKVLNSGLRLIRFKVRDGKIRWEPLGLAVR
jgi:hypothetical protein